MPKLTGNLRNWCASLGTALTDRIGQTIIVHLDGANALRFEVAATATGEHHGVAGRLALPCPARMFALSNEPREFAETIWALVGSWADFFQYWHDHRAEAA